MNTYRIYKGGHSILANFATLQEAQDYANNLGYNVEISEEQIQESIEDKLKKDLVFGRFLIELYLIDDKELNLSIQDSLNALQKFSAVKALCEVGAINAVAIILESIELDANFTKNRKDKYLNLIKNYLK